MLVNISTKFHEDILNSFKVIERKHFVTETATYKIQRGITQAQYIQELWFLRSARLPMLVNIYMKFHEDILNGFEVTERTRFCEGQKDRQTDGRTDDRGKNNISLNPEGGRHN